MRSKRAILGIIASCLLLAFTTASAALAKPKASERTWIAFVGGQELSGTYTSEPVYANPEATRGETPDSFGWWSGGWYYDSVSNSLLQNNVWEGPAEAFKMLGKGVCMDTSDSTSLSGSIKYTMGGSVESINRSFEFTASGTKEWIHTYKYCGPDNSSPYSRRTFYKVLIYNKYRSYVTRYYYCWNGNFCGAESFAREEEVPYLGIYSRDS